jgi:hypothetical protein
MASTRLPKWSALTREERFFTCILFGDLACDPRPLWGLLRNQIGYSRSVRVIDQGYEVCLFRDAARPKYGLVRRHEELEKVTFDLILTLSNRAMVIIEAKAHQSYSRAQIEVLHRCQKILQNTRTWPAKPVHIAALCSSRYQISDRTRGDFDALITWGQLAESYSDNRSHYLHADSIYGD